MGNLDLGQRVRHLLDSLRCDQLSRRLCSKQERQRFEGHGYGQLT